MVPTIADRVITAIPTIGCDLKLLRRGLSDLPAEPLDCAITGLREGGQITILDGYVMLKQPAQIAPPARHRLPPPISHPWKRLPAVQKSGR